MTLPERLSFYIDIVLLGKERAEKRRQIAGKYLHGDQVSLANIFLNADNSFEYYRSRIHFYEEIEAGRIPERLPVLISPQGRSSVHHDDIYYARISPPKRHSL